MSLLSRLRQKIKPKKIYKDPHAGSLHRGVMFCFDDECWDYTEKEHPEYIENLLGWARQNLWKDIHAYWILRRHVHNGEQKE